VFPSLFSMRNTAYTGVDVNNLKYFSKHLTVLLLIVNVGVVCTFSKSAIGQSKSTKELKESCSLTVADSIDLVKKFYGKFYIVCSVTKHKIHDIDVVVVQGVNSPGVVISDVFIYIKIAGEFRLYSTFWHRFGLPQISIDSKQDTIQVNYSKSGFVDRVKIDFKWVN